MFCFQFIKVVSGQQAISSVDCVINQEYSISCLQENDEVYVPFSFLHEYFEVYGSLSTIGKGPARFDWSHSNAKVNHPKGTYDPKGIFMYFENYNVEVCQCDRRFGNDICCGVFNSEFSFFR